MHEYREARCPILVTGAGSVVHAGSPLLQHTMNTDHLNSDVPNVLKNGSASCGDFCMVLSVRNRAQSTEACGAAYAMMTLTLGQGRPRQTHSESGGRRSLGRVTELARCYAVWRKGPTVRTTSS
jgi:hypothetical protein